MLPALVRNFTLGPPPLAVPRRLDRPIFPPSTVDTGISLLTPPALVEASSSNPAPAGRIRLMPPAEVFKSTDSFGAWVIAA